jgi:hypothetical protein
LKAAIAHGQRLIGVSYDLRRGYYITTTTNVPPTAALSLAGLRKQSEAALMPNAADIKLMLDRAARVERDLRRRGAAVPRL